MDKLLQNIIKFSCIVTLANYGESFNFLKLTNGIVDLSHWNVNINITKAKNHGLKAIIHKATQGLNFIDADYARRREDAEKNALYWGAYHFGTSDDGLKQADHFLKTIDNYKGMVLALDVETNPSGQTMTPVEAVKFVKRIEEKTGRLPLIYGSPYFLNNFTVGILSKCPLWIATWGPKPILPRAWSDFIIWQHTDGTKGIEPDPVPGIGKCDKDKFNGSLQDLKKFWESYYD